MDSTIPHWEGRISIRIHSEPKQAFSAAFELVGSSDTGTLVFTSPLGNIVAQLQWNAQGASLSSGGEPQQFDSLDSLMRKTTGTELPVGSLLSWLQGRDAPSPGWQANLQALPSGRLSAQRLDPAPVVDLSIVLERPVR